MIHKNPSLNEAGEWSSQSEEKDENARRSKVLTIQRNTGSHATPQSKNMNMNEMMRSNNKKTPGALNQDFIPQLNAINHLSIDSDKTNKIWYSNAKDQGPKPKLIDENIPIYHTNIKEKRPRVNEQGESENHFSSRRMQAKNIGSIGKKSIQEKNELNQKNEQQIREKTQAIISETLNQDQLIAKVKATPSMTQC